MIFSSTNQRLISRQKKIVRGTGRGKARSFTRENEIEMSSTKENNVTSQCFRSFRLVTSFLILDVYTCTPRHSLLLLLISRRVKPYKVDEAIVFKEMF